VRRLSTALGFVLLLAAWAGQASAQSFEVLADFGEPEGMTPSAGLIQGSDGHFYGTTAGGGNGFGTIYKVTSTGAITTLHLFKDADGNRPESSLVQGFDGNFYGTTRLGGASGKGVVFKFNPLNDTLTVLLHFNTTNGQDPAGGLVQGNDGNLYGTTSYGGLTGCGSTCGTIFRISPTGVFATLVKFNKTNGATPKAGLTKGSNGRLYGTTSRGGVYDRGTVFSFDPFGTSVTTLHSFNMTEGLMPESGLIQAPDGFFYGTANLGGAFNKGTVYRISATGGLVALYSFAGPEGGNPRANLVRASDGRLYGVTSSGGTYSKGTVFSMTTSGVVTALRSLTAADGSTSYGALLEGSTGMLFGTTSVGGPPGSAGTAFKITTAGALTLLHAFKGSPVKPYAALVEGSDGRLRGTTYGGGGANKGTVYSIDSFGTVDVVHAFSGTDGATPSAGVTQSKLTGIWYGATATGGANQGGSIVKLGPTAPLSVLTSLIPTTTGYSPYSGVVEAPNGNLYGVTYLGGTYGGGTLYQVSPTGTVTVRYHFTTTTGAKPHSTPIIAPNGRLYGTATTGGAGSVGVLYSYDPVSSVYTRLVSFTGANGSNPRGGLLYASDGFIYGTTVYGGANSSGTIFRFDPATNALTTLYSFDGAHGSMPYAGLIEGSDGLLYGTTYYGGASTLGTVYQFNRTTRVLTTLRSFSGGDGANPQSALVQASDGRLYGTTGVGGSTGNGIVYRLTPGAPAPAPDPTFAVALTTPNGGETLTTGIPYTVMWSVSGTASLISAFDLQFSSNGGSTFAAVTGCTGLSGAARSCTWASPGPATTTGRMRLVVRDTAGNVDSDDSNANFTIAAPATFDIALTAPNGGETLTTGTPYTVRWSVSGTASLISSFDLYSSSDGGASFTAVTGCMGLSGAARSCTWASPGPATTAGRMRLVVKDTAGKLDSDDSNANFTIAAAATATSMIVTTPNSAVNWGIGSVQPIKWNHQLGRAAYVKIELSRDGGATWEVLEGSTKNTGDTTGVYFWTVAGPVTTRGRIRVTAADGSATDTSDANFTIAAPYVTVIGPNLSTSLWTVGQKVAVKWAHNLSGQENVKIELSRDGGVTYPVTILAATPSSGSETVLVDPSWVTGAARVRVTWLQNPTISDASDASFTIK
jgi:uncharacterized repeat protein (TIGR03803 family)